MAVFVDAINGCILSTTTIKPKNDVGPFRVFRFLSHLIFRRSFPSFPVTVDFALARNMFIGCIVGNLLRRQHVGKRYFLTRPSKIELFEYNYSFSISTFDRE